jgi:alpha-L-fucosidase 2
MEHGQLYSYGSYHRKLDLSDGMITVTYKIGGITYTREIFASYPDQVIVVHLTASKEGFLSFRSLLDSPLRHMTCADKEDCTIYGHAPEHVSPSYYDSEDPIRYGTPQASRGLSFHGRLAAVCEGGMIKTEADGLHVEGATNATLYFSAATSFDSHIGASNPEIRPELITDKTIRAINRREYEEIRKRHIADHFALFNRVTLHLGDSIAPMDMSTERRIAEFGAKDPGLVE